MKVTAENLELVLQNTNGDTIIIPKTHREKVLKYIEEGNYKAIDDIAEGLPFMEDYADKGSLIVEGIGPGDGEPKDETGTSVVDLLNPFGKTHQQARKLIKGVAQLNLGSDEPIPDFSSETDVSKAYTKARSQGYPQYTWKGKTYDTKHKGTPEEQLKETGITDNQMFTKNTIQRRLANNMFPYGYENMADRFIQAGVENKKDPRRLNMEEGLKKEKEGTENLELAAWKQRMDSNNFYSGLPQQYGTFSISKRKPSKSKDPNAIYYSLNNKELTNSLLDQSFVFEEELPQAKHLLNQLGSDIKNNEEQLNKLIEYAGTLNDAFTSTSNIEDIKQGGESTVLAYNEMRKAFPNATDDELQNYSRYLNNYSPKTGGKILKAIEPVMGDFTSTLGEDDRGKYISYYDNWDIAASRDLEKSIGLKTNFGKPFEIYDRIYYKDYEGKGRRQMYFSDKELRSLNLNDKSINREELQEELANRGYDDKDINKAYAAWSAKNKLPSIKKEVKEAKIALKQLAKKYNRPGIKLKN
jgi:hypothetical protein